MPLKIPDIASAKLENLSACGEIRSPSKGLREWAAKYEESWMYYRLKGPMLCRVGVDEFEKFVHLHIDVTLKSFFEPLKPPRPSRDAPPLDKLLIPFIGQEVAVDVFGNFAVPLTDSPRLVAMTYNLAIEVQGAEGRMTAGTISFKGLSLKTYSWQVDAEKEKAKIRIKGEATTLRFTDTYLVECLQFITTIASPFLAKGG